MFKPHKGSPPSNHVQNRIFCDGAHDRNRTGEPLPYQGSALPTELRGHKLITASCKELKNNLIIVWSGRRDLNSRHPAWKAEALPTELLPLFRYELQIGRLNLFPQELKSISCRKSCSSNRSPKLNRNLLQSTQLRLVVGGGFEPPKASPTDLQSVPFDRSGTPP